MKNKVANIFLKRRFFLFLALVIIMLSSCIIPDQLPLDEAFHPGIDIGPTNLWGDLWGSMQWGP